MKSPYNTRPYALKPRSAADKRRRALVLYVAIFSGPVAAAVLSMAVAIAMH